MKTFYERHVTDLNTKFFPPSDQTDDQLSKTRTNVCGEDISKDLRLITL